VGTGAGAVSGGIGSKIAGGNFWDGFRQGAITAGLNHGVHDGWFGANVAAAAMTQQLRHLIGPDAYDWSISGMIAPILGGKLKKGYIQMLRGNNKGDFYDGLGGVVSTPSLSGEFSKTNLYYSGSVSSMNIDSFTGVYYSLNLGADVGISVGMSASYSPIPNTNNFVLGYGESIGLGFSLFLFDINLEAGSIGTKNFFKNK
jgi:hypothetical protein